MNIKVLVECYVTDRYKCPMAHHKVLFMSFTIFNIFIKIMIVLLKSRPKDYTIKSTTYRFMNREAGIIQNHSALEINKMKIAMLYNTYCKIIFEHVLFILINT